MLRTEREIVVANSTHIVYCMLYGLRQMTPPSFVSSSSFFRPVVPCTRVGYKGLTTNGSLRVSTLQMVLVVGLNSNAIATWYGYISSIV
jgi:hypothetical protein